MWGARRLSQGTIRSDFDLELLKKGIKGRYEIFGHGQHPWQQAIKKIGMEEEFYGHIIQIDDSKNAVWFKLNYDNIGKNITKYIGGWRDLNPDDILPYITQYQLLEQSHRRLVDHISTIRNQYYYLNQMISPRAPLHDAMLPAANQAASYKASLDAANETLKGLVDETITQKAALQDAVRAYLKEHGG